MKLALLGSNGAIGQPLALLLATSNRVKELVLHDIVDQIGVSTDLSHIDVQCNISSASTTAEAVKDADIIAVSAGCARKPGMSRDDLFNTNSKIIYEISKTVARNNPQAMLAIITNPINGTVPIACETFIREGIKDTKNIFGVTSLDIMRANRFIGNILERDPSSVFCPVVGGHAGETITPLLSQCSSSDGTSLLVGPLESDDAQRELIERIQNAGTEVVNAKKNGSASLSMAYAAYMFLMNLMNAKSGMEVKEYCFIDLRHFGKPYGNYFSLPVLINEAGVSKTLASWKGLFEREENALTKAMEEVSKSVKKSKEYIENMD